jgi:hypothetical protein
LEKEMAEESTPHKGKVYDDQLQAGLDADIPEIYFNGFVSGVGSGDLLLILQRDGKPVARLNTSFTLAKTLAIKLTGLIHNLEGSTGTKIMTTDDVNNKMPKKN